MANLNRSSIAQVKAGEVSKADGHLVIAMRVYPRFLAKTLIDEYARELSPEAALFGRYRDLKKQGLSQNEAFRQAGYEREFELSDEGVVKLKKLIDLSRRQRVFLICQCANDEHCHVDLMLLLAEKKFGAVIGRVASDYSEFCARI